MNKEAKAIVEYLEEEREAIRTLCYYPDDVLNCEDLIMLMDYINQLEKEVERLKEREKLVTEHYDVMVRHAGNLEGKIVVLETNKNTAIEFIDQELQYHLSPFEYKQVDEDINTLIGILRGGSNE